MESRWGWGAWAPPSFPQPTICCHMGLSADQCAWGMAAKSQQIHGLYPDEVGHNYILEVQESALAGPGSTGPEPFVENSEPSRSKP